MRFHLAVCFDFAVHINPDLLMKVLMILVYML